MPATWWRPATAGRGKPSRSASSIVADTASGSHCLKVDGFSRTKGLPDGDRLKSSPFTVGGHRWHIYFQPNSGGTEGYISVFLVLDEDVSRPVRAQFKFSVGAENRPPFFLMKKMLKHAPFTPRVSIRDFASHHAWGFTKFLKWENLEKEGYLKYDCLMIKCSIVVINEFRTEGMTSSTTTPSAPSFVSVPTSDLCHHLGVLLETEKGADVVFQVGGETFWAHQCVLAARSPVFSAELFGAMIERNVAHVNSIDDMEAPVFRALLCFIYTDSLPEMKKDEEEIMFQHLLVAADRYNMERLKLICEEKLCKYINAGTVATMLVLADQQRCDGLKKACFGFLNIQQT